MKDQLARPKRTRANDIWAVGQTTDRGCCHPVKCAGAILHWNGKSWSGPN